VYPRRCYEHGEESGAVAGEGGVSAVRPAAHFLSLSRAVASHYSGFGKYYDDVYALLVAGVEYVVAPGEGRGRRQDQQR
jgi:hypothetical protein